MILNFSNQKLKSFNLNHNFYVINFANLSKSTFPPLIITPTLLPLKSMPEY